MILWLLAGYMWLYVHRPFEVWPWLAGYSIERVYMVVLIGYWFGFTPKSVPRNLLLTGWVLLTGVIFLSWLTSPFRAVGWPTVENHLKILAFFLIVVTSVRDYKSLRFLLFAFLASTALYMAHSLWEYYNGRYNWRMATVRMIGVDLTFGSPNAFAGTICYSLPIATGLLLIAKRFVDQVALGSYWVLAATCILLTGSRSGLIGIIFVALALVGLTKHRVKVLLMLALLAAVAFTALPEDRKNRFLTLIDPEYGPHTAQSSAEGRTRGLLDGISIWSNNPILGVGPGAHPMVSYHGRPLHNLYGQLLAELGTVGAVAFVFVLAGYGVNYVVIQRLYREHGATELGELKQIVFWIVVSIGQLLLMGYAGHNLYRYQWLWFAAFQICTLQVAIGISHFLADMDAEGELPAT